MSALGGRGSADVMVIPMQAVGTLREAVGKLLHEEQQCPGSYK
jgi:hypothetical protein